MRWRSRSRSSSRSGSCNLRRGNGIIAGMSLRLLAVACLAELSALAEDGADAGAPPCSLVS